MSTLPHSPWFCREVGAPRVHLLGLSMGGAVAQELALLAPERIDHLILVGTFCGPRKSVPPDPAVWELLGRSQGLSRVEQIKALLPVYYSRPFLDANETCLLALTARGTRTNSFGSLPPIELTRDNQDLGAEDLWMSDDPLVKVSALLQAGSASVIAPAGIAADPFTV